MTHTSPDTTARRLQSEKRTLVVVTTEHGEPYWEGGINGCFYRIRTGEPVLVAEPLAKLIAESARVSIESRDKLAAYENTGVRVG